MAEGQPDPGEKIELAEIHHELVCPNEDNGGDLPPANNNTTRYEPQPHDSYARNHSYALRHTNAAPLRNPGVPLRNATTQAHAPGFRNRDDLHRRIDPRVGW